MKDQEPSDAEFFELLTRAVTALETIAKGFEEIQIDMELKAPPVAEYSTVIIGPEDEAPAEGPEEGIAHGHPIDEEVAHAAMDPLCNPEAPRFDEEDNYPQCPNCDGDSRRAPTEGQWECEDCHYRWKVDEAPAEVFRPDYPPGDEAHDPDYKPTGPPEHVEVP